MSDPASTIDFDPIASGYDRCNRLFSLGIDRRWRRRLVRTLQPQPHHRVLDLCTGTGDLAFAFCRYSPVRHVTGVDISGAMLSLAQEKEIGLYGKRWLQGKQLAWHCADAGATGLAGQSFDIVTCAFGLRNIPDRAAALGEIRRLLKPTGRLCILEFSLPANPVLRMPYWFYLNHLMPVAGRWIVGSSEPLKYLARSIRHWHTAVNFDTELSRAGFSLFQKTALTGGLVTLRLAKIR